MRQCAWALVRVLRAPLGKQSTKNGQPFEKAGPTGHVLRERWYELREIPLFMHHSMTILDTMVALQLVLRHTRPVTSPWSPGTICFARRNLKSAMRRMDLRTAKGSCSLETELSHEQVLYVACQIFSVV